MTFLDQYAALSPVAGEPSSAAEFANTQLEVARGETIRSAALYKAYVAWATVPSTHTAFSLALRRLGLRNKKMGWITWQDIRLKL